MFRNENFESWFVRYNRREKILEISKQTEILSLNKNYFGPKEKRRLQAEET